MVQQENSVFILSWYENIDGTDIYRSSGVDMIGNTYFDVSGSVFFAEISVEREGGFW